VTRRLINSTYKNKGIHNFEMALRTIETTENQKFVAKNVTKTLRASEQRKFKIYDDCLEDPLAIFCRTKLENKIVISHISKYSSVPIFSVPKRKYWN
jgi:hypothetical protein